MIKAGLWLSRELWTLTQLQHILPLYIVTERAWVCINWDRVHSPIQLQACFDYDDGAPLRWILEWNRAQASQQMPFNHSAAQTTYKQTTSVTILQYGPAPNLRQLQAIVHSDSIRCKLRQYEPIDPRVRFDPSTSGESTDDIGARYLVFRG